MVENMADIQNTKYECINGFNLVTDWKTSGTAQWAYAERDGQRWFIKRFLSPKYKKAGEGISEKMAEKSRQRCELFQQKQNIFYTQIKKSDTGNIIFITDFFNYDSFFYAVSPRIDIANVSMTQLASLPERKKILLLKILAHSLKNLHANGVVHADLKPSNIILKKTSSGNYTLKIIDFDGGFLETDPRREDNIVFDPVYAAPETILALSDPEINLTRKIDIFALGLIFHQYYTGKLPTFPKEFTYACDAALNGQPIYLSEELPDWLSKMVTDMLDPVPEKRISIEVVFQQLNALEKPSTTSPSFFHIPRL